MKKRSAIRWPWRRAPNRLGLTKGGRAPVRPERRTLKLAVITGCGLASALTGSTFGDDLLALLAPEHSRVATLAVAGNVHTEPAVLASATGLAAGAALADIDPDDLSRMLEALPWVREARAATLTPNRVMIAIEERVPVAVAKLADGSRHLVDASGVAFAPAPPETRGPERGGLASLPAAPEAHAGLAAGVALLEQWSAAKLPAALVVVIASSTPDELPAVQLADRPLRVVIGRGDATAKLARLARILALNEPALASAREIDLRFPGEGVLRFAAPCPAGDELLGEAAPAGKDSAGVVPVGGEEKCHAETT